MAKKSMWMVRAEGGELIEDFREKSLVAMGLKELGPLNGLSRKQIAALIEQHLPHWSEGKARMWSGMLYRFQNDVAIGDYVITYDPSRRVYLVGSVASECRHDPKTIPGDPLVRSVTWQGEVARDDLTVSTRNRLGSISTFFEIAPEAIADIERALKGDRPPEVASTTVIEVEEETVRKDIEAQALEFIKDKVNRLDWEQMQHLVAGVLRAMGYKTRVSPSGPDRGKDIVASPDGFGFESPRIVVEVKHRPRDTMGSQEIRSFLGGRHKDDKGLYVSTGGFSKDAHYEAERANIPLTLMDIDSLVEAILEHYENMDIDTQRMVPLKKIYWPA